MHILQVKHYQYSGMANNDVHLHSPVNAYFYNFYTLYRFKLRLGGCRSVGVRPETIIYSYQRNHCLIFLTCLKLSKGNYDMPIRIILYIYMNTILVKAFNVLFNSNVSCLPMSTIMPVDYCPSLRGSQIDCSACSCTPTGISSIAFNYYDN